MSDRSAIEWTEATWNPVTGCTKVSTGCDNCYAEAFAERFRGVPGHPYEQGFDLRLWPHRLEQPMKWRRPRIIFVNSMSDLFHEDVPIEFIERVIRVVEQTPHHTYQVLTKRPGRMASVLNRIGREPLPNLWLGTSIEVDRYVWRADKLRETGAAVRFLSLEPLLGPLPSLDLSDIDWVIVGGESGQGIAARRRTSFSCSSSLFRFFSARISASSESVSPSRLPSSISARRTQRLRQDCETPKSRATWLIGASCRRATATTSLRDSSGNAFGMVSFLPSEGESSQVRWVTPGVAWVRSPPRCATP
ncbi:MAG: phage Gp37/Gp68 family protein, partial [Acidimicrobiia bacterium]